MRKNKTCKVCGSPFIKENHLMDEYNIVINRCKCGWKLVDVLDKDGNSLIEVIDKKIVEKMLKSKASSLKI